MPFLALVALCDTLPKKWRSFYCRAIIGANDPGDLLGRVARGKKIYNSTTSEVCSQLHTLKIKGYCALRQVWVSHLIAMLLHCSPTSISLVPAHSPGEIVSEGSRHEPFCSVLRL